MAATKNTSHHFLSLFIPALKEHADRTICRPLVGRLQWGTITFREWDERLEAARVYFVESLSSLGMKQGEVVGLWLTGSKWTDLLITSSLSAAGYIPQLFSSVFSPEMIRTLLHMSSAKALVYDTEEYSNIPSEITIPTFPAPDAEGLQNLVSQLRRLRKGPVCTYESDLVPVAERQPAMIFHSSGTTSGIPKLIPSSHLLMKTFLLEKTPDNLFGGDYDVPTNVYNSLGSLAHIGTFQLFHGVAAHGCCVIQASSMAMGSEEMVAMTRQCGLNRLVQYATFISIHIRAAQKDDVVKEVLQNMRQVLHAGVSLHPEDEKWGLENGLMLTSMYGASETGPLLVSKFGLTPSSRLFRPCRGASPIFVPYTTESESHPVASSSQAPEGRPILYEIVIAPGAPDAPPTELFGEDGYWHTQDVFEKFSPEDGQPVGWVYRGRAGDWIKTTPGFVDTKAIEDAVRRECHDMPIADVLVVGSSRAHPVLIVETTLEEVSADTQRDLSAEMVRRIEGPGQAMFPSERIHDPRWVLVVEKGKLLRNKEKGNLRRGANEELFKSDIDAIFG